MEMRNFDHGLSGGDGNLIIFAEASGMVEPGESAFYHLRPGRKFCVKSDKHQSRKREQNKGLLWLDTAQLNQASPPVFRDGRRYARAA